jgi:CheY-like chemotaxis protein
VAEDDGNDALLLQMAFKKAGLTQRVIVVPDGEKVVEYIKGEGAYADRAQFPFPQVLLLDLKMPRMNGLEVLAWLQAQEEARHLPAVVLTSSCYNPDVRKAYELGAYSFITKPTEIDELASALKSMDDFWQHGPKPPGTQPFVPPPN